MPSYHWKCHLLFNQFSCGWTFEVIYNFSVFKNNSLIPAPLYMLLITSTWRNPKKQIVKWKPVLLRIFASNASGESCTCLNFYECIAVSFCSNLDLRSTNSTLFVLFLSFFFFATLGLHCGAQGSLIVVWGILVPQLGIELTFPALEGRFLTTGPSGKSLFNSF